jgi:hypothetical protein
VRLHTYGKVLHLVIAGGIANSQRTWQRQGRHAARNKIVIQARGLGVGWYTPHLHITMSLYFKDNEDIRKKLKIQSVQNNINEINEHRYKWINHVDKMSNETIPEQTVLHTE